MQAHFFRVLFAASLFIGCLCSVRGQTNFAVLASDGGWTWYNDPRAVYHNGILYFGYVRADAKTALSAFNPETGVTTDLWVSEFSQRDDHNNPGLLVKQDDTILAIYARHGSDQFFAYRLSNNTNPVAPEDWSAELRIPNSGAGLTYANPFQLSAESGRIYNYCRNLNFNPTVYTSEDGGLTWSAPKLMLKNGTGGIRPYMKYASDYNKRVDFLYTDGHPRNVNNSLYHLYYENGAFYRTDGTLVRTFDTLPILHDSGERGSVIYAYSNEATTDPNDHISTGRAWCWEVGYQTNGAPVALFTVQRDLVTGQNWSDDRIYYYYARWTGTEWQKRLIAHAGRPLYESEDDYAGGICADPEDPSVVYISSNALNPFNTEDLDNVPLKPANRYELYRGVTTDGGLTFTWTTVTSNSSKDNLRPYVPRHQGAGESVIWFRGSYPTFTSYNCEVVGLFQNPIPQKPAVEILSPVGSAAAFTNLNNSLLVQAAVSGIEVGSGTVAWETVSGPAEAIFSNPSSQRSYAQFPAAGTYILRVTASNAVAIAEAEVSVSVGPPTIVDVDESCTLWLKLDEIAGTTAADSSGAANNGTIAGTAGWQPSGGWKDGALSFNGVNTVVTVPDADNLDDTSAFTLTYWFYMRAYPADSAGLVSKRNAATSENAYTTWIKGPEKLLYVDVQSSNDRFASASLIQTGQWYHVALVFDGSRSSNQRVSLFLNGALDRVANETSPMVSNYSSLLRVGNTHAGAPYWFDGLIDEVRFYRRALSPAEIYSMGNKNFAPSIVLGNPPAIKSGVPTTVTASAVDDGFPGPIQVGWLLESGAGAVFSNANSFTTQATFPRAGVYTLRFTASDSLAEVSQSLDLTVALNTNVYADWIVDSYQGTPDLQMIATGADPDGDKLPNLVEFALGLNPFLAGAEQFGESGPGLPKPRIIESNGKKYLALEVRRPIGRLGISYLGAGGSDLGGTEPWQVLPASSPQTGPPGFETILFEDWMPMEDNPQRFLRLLVRE
jgi:hypothetical protein